MDGRNRRRCDQSGRGSMAFTQQACQLRVVEGLTGFSNMSLPCFSTKAFALLASIESSQGSCTSSLTWSSATSTVPVVLCPMRLARKSRWSPDHWFLNTNKPAPLDWASLKLAFNLLNASSLPRRCGSRFSAPIWYELTDGQVVTADFPAPQCCRVRGIASAEE